jgi:hypothetical protein
LDQRPQFYNMIIFVFEGHKRGYLCAEFMLILKTKMRGIRSLLKSLLICGIRIWLQNLFCPSVGEMSLCSPSNHISTYRLVQLKIQASPKKEDPTGTFVLPISWCSQNDDHPEKKHLTRFGYVPNMKVLKKKDPSIFLFTYWNLSLKSGYRGRNLKSDKFGPFFFSWKMFWHK